MNSATYHICMIGSASTPMIPHITSEPIFTVTAHPDVPGPGEHVYDAVVVDATTLPARDIVGRLRASSHMFDMPVLVCGGEPPTYPAMIDAHLPAGANDRDLADTLTHLAGSSAAIRQLRQALHQREHQIATLQDAHQKKDEFLSVILHELKNPMASIKGYADLLRRRAERNEQDPNLKGLRVISHQIGRMSASVEQLLDFSRISRQRLELRRKDTDLRVLLSAIIEEQQADAPEHTLALQVGADDFVTSIDEARIGQTLINVLTNAIRYSPGGGPIAVRLERGEGGDGPQAVITITDSGIGIERGDQARVFEQFYRGKEAASLASGLGLGLFLARGVVERHGGTVTIESPAGGRGTAVRLALPLTGPTALEEG